MKEKKYEKNVMMNEGKGKGDGSKKIDSMMITFYICALIIGGNMEESGKEGCSITDLQRQQEIVVHFNQQ
uniref:Uncharacterized protein n=1 Tax=Romanomermis culicivorax TaxID=13658 RepID=A0A915K228_ROMCU